MATAVILDTQKFRKTKASAADYPITDILDSTHNAEITYDAYFTDLEAKSYPITTIEDSKYHSNIESILEFRVRFENIGFLGYGPSNPAPIGIAIIGFNNYIL
jgi:hypothetical protein